jgi:protein phosphatase
MRSFGKTDKGIQRNSNEDVIFFSDHPVGQLPNLYIIADGMGGHNAGLVASENAVKSFLSYVIETNKKNPIEVFKEGIQRSNALIFEKAEAEEQYYRMGTTFIVCAFLENKLYIGNIGDSRLYTIYKDINKITKDHSLVEEMLHKGHITETEAKNHPERHVITRAVGIDATIDVDTYEIPLEGNEMVLMCSDGLTNMLDDKIIYNILKEDMDIESKVKQLIQQANENGGNDNISVILIEWDR